MPDTDLLPRHRRDPRHHGSRCGSTATGPVSGRCPGGSARSGRTWSASAPGCRSAAGRRWRPGTTVEDVAADLRWAMRRYPTFRTRLRFDADGTPAAVGRRVGHDRAGRVRRARRRRPRGLHGGRRRALPGPGLRLRRRVAGADGGGPARRRARVPVDGHLPPRHRRLRRPAHAPRGRRPSAGAEPGPTTGLQPLEQAAGRRPRTGRSSAGKALRHWERCCGNCPPGDGAHARPGPRFHRGEFRVGGPVHRPPTRSPPSPTSTRPRC